MSADDCGRQHLYSGIKAVFGDEGQQLERYALRMMFLAAFPLTEDAYGDVRYLANTTRLTHLAPAIS